MPLLKGKVQYTVNRKSSMKITAFVNMCQQSPGLCKGNLGISRAKMPQIKAGSLNLLLDIAKDRGIRVSRGRTVASKLKPVQSEISLELAETTRDNMIAGTFDLNGDPLVLSEKNYILNGHHRWAGALLAESEGINLPLIYVKFHVPIQELLEIIQGLGNVKYRDIDHSIAKRFERRANILFYGKSSADVALDLYGSAKVASEDFCKIEKGICDGNLGIPRVKMPQIPEKKVEHFVSFLKEEGFRAQKKKVPVDSLRATQKEINADKAEAISGKIVDGTFEMDPPVVVSSDNHILDGHHRWAGGLLAKVREGLDVMMSVIKVNLPIKKLLELAHDFDGVEYAGFHD
jgi:ParB-like chromosome segregation protein Spo0J